MVQKNFVQSFDFTTAFLYRTLTDEAFMEIPQGLGEQKNKFVCTSEWNEHSTQFL